MSFGIVQDEAYRAAPGLDAVIEQISADDADPRLITKVTHSTASEAQAAATRGDTNGYLAVEDGDPVLHVTQKGNEAETTQVLRVVMDSYTQKRAELEAVIKAGVPPEQTAALQVNHSFTHSISVTPSPVKPATRYYFALLAFASGMGMTVTMTTVQSIMASSPLGAAEPWRVCRGGRSSPPRSRPPGCASWPVCSSPSPSSPRWWVWTSGLTCCCAW